MVAASRVGSFTIVSSGSSVAHENISVERVRSMLNRYCHSAAYACGVVATCSMTFTTESGPVRLHLFCTRYSAYPSGPSSP